MEGFYFYSYRVSGEETEGLKMARSKLKFKAHEVKTTEINTRDADHTNHGDDARYCVFGTGDTADVWPVDADGVKYGGLSLPANSTIAVSAGEQVTYKCGKTDTVIEIHEKGV